VEVITRGDHDINAFTMAGERIAAEMCTISMATEFFEINPEDGSLAQISAINKSVYDNIRMGEVQKRWVKTTDGKQMLTWVILPPDFDPAKKYPTLLYCEGGPQSVVSQFWSYRWNFQLMAANGYIVVAPNRRGVPSFGQEWLDQISGDYSGQNIRDLLTKVTLVLAPAVDPDGIDLVTGALDAENTAAARTLAANYPDIPFPSGWKANIRGIDLNLQYPAGWSIAREIKFAAGYTRPGPRDYVGPAPLVAPESLAMYGFTRALDPLLTLSYHTQGRVIYWQYDGYDVPGSKAIAKQFAAVSGYDVAETPYASGHAGYKDWFLQDYRRPGFTIERAAGKIPCR
jgi:hypothetical protein